MTNPYKDIPDYCFWSRSVTWAPEGRLDPVVRARQIAPTEKIVTMGSCFAQHLSQHIERCGLHYFVAERAPSGCSKEEARRRNFGVFSARYGNVYTARQAVQLFDRAFGDFSPADGIWRRGEGFVDAFRPQIEPEPIESAECVEQSAAAHLANVREVFTQADWLIFTLGLTEAWRSRLDGAIYPVAPGVSGGVFDTNLYEFVNFTAEEVREDLSGLVDRLRSVNAKANIILTVSPVPLIATYERRHVLVSTTFSKAALRVAADEIERKFEHVFYFPSYEIITSPSSGGRYYQDDLRQVTATGVKHVMNVFSAHFISNNVASNRAEGGPARDSGPLQNGPDIVCDEETIERALRISGFGRTAPHGNECGN